MGGRSRAQLRVPPISTGGAEPEVLGLDAPATPRAPAPPRAGGRSTHRCARLARWEYPASTKVKSKCGASGGACKKYGSKFNNASSQSSWKQTSYLRLWLGTDLGWSYAE